MRNCGTASARWLDRPAPTDSMRGPMRPQVPYATVLFVLLGALTGWLASGLVPPALRGAFLADQDFHLTRKADTALEITEGKWFFLPYLYGDFDLQFDVELAEGAELDVLLRQVEPRRDGDRLLPFHGRFADLRISTVREAAGFRTREQALLGPRDGGVKVEPGITSTVWIEACGRNLKANVAGKPLPWFAADDEYGMVTLLVHGGKAVLHRFDLVHKGLGSPWVWSRPFWAGLGGVLALLFWLAARPYVPAASLLGWSWLPPLWAWLMVRRFDLQLGLPEPASILCVLVASLALVLAPRIEGWRKLPLVAFVLGSLWFGNRLLQRDDRAIDAVFGPQAGSQLSEAMGQLVRGPNGLHDVDRPGTRVFLLGGQMLYTRNCTAQPGEHLELLLQRELRTRTNQPVDVPCLPTIDGHATQQVGLFTRFFANYRPRVLVLGVGAFENTFDPATGAPRSSRAQLLAAIAALRTACEQHGSKPVLWVERAIDDELLAVLRDAEQQGIPLVVAAVDHDPATIAKNLAAVIAPLLGP